MDRFKAWLGRPASAKWRTLRAVLQRAIGTRFLLVGGDGLATYSAYHPDSYAVFDRHPEFKSLYARFCHHNRRNNGGDIARLWSLVLNIKQVLAQGVEGDFAEVGVWRGNTAAVLAKYAGLGGRQTFLFDTFAGFAAADLTGIDSNKHLAFADTSVELVKNTVKLDRPDIHYVKGYFPGTLTPEHEGRSFAVVSLDCDLYEPMRAGLEFFYPRMKIGGLLLLHDYSSGFWDGATRAVDEFVSRTGEQITLLPDKSGGAVCKISRAVPY